MLLFVGIDGFSKFGTYEGNAAANGPFVSLTFRPAFVWIKWLDGVQAWHLFDKDRTASGTNLGINEGTTTGKEFFATETSAAEVSTSANIDFLSNGFKIRASGNGVNNATSYIYMAFAERPFGGDGVSQARAK